MEAEFIEKMRLFYEKCYKLEYGTDIVAAVNGGEPGNYDNNPTIEEYAQKGYKFFDANMFGHGDECGEILLFRQISEK